MMAPDTLLHASAVAIGGRAVLITGPSGSGKSDLALRLIDRGARLVSDDYVSLRVVKSLLLASPAPNIAGKIEVRGVGIVERPWLRDVPVGLLVDLAITPARLPSGADTRLLSEIAIPWIGLHALEASAPVKVEEALKILGLRL